MSQSENTVTGLAPGGVYPSPPASPRPTTTSNEIFAGKNTETTKITQKTNDATTKEAAIRVTEEPAKARPVTPAEPTVSETTEELADAEEKLILETWKRALYLDEGKCGAIKKFSKSNERCIKKVASSKAAEIDKLIEMLRRPNESPRQIETHLDNLAKLVHCRYHDHPPICQARIDEWLAALPGSPRTPTLERQLRNSLGPAPSKCTSLTKHGEPCKWNVKRENQYFCEKTISKMVQMAMAPPDDDDTLDDLVAVLRYHMLCHIHHKYTPTYQPEWTSAINKFQVACQHQITRQEIENAAAQANTGKGKGKTVVNGGGGNYAFGTPPSTPNSRKVSKNPSDYWEEGFDASPFNILGKNDTLEEDMTPSRWIRSVAEEPLNTGSKNGENEVNSGYVYAFTVPGNEGFVKIGFTTREGVARHNEWEKDCNREPTVIYPATKVVPHAHRVEKLVHAELTEHRVRIYCERCQKQHIEWFEVSANMAIASVKKWSLWMAGAPYEERVTQDGLRWHLRETEMKRLDDIGKFLKDLREAVETAESGKQTLQ